MNRIYHHPMNAANTVLGQPLCPGEKTVEGDVYDSTNGKWELMHSGIIVQRGHAAMIIRPAKCTAGAPVSHDLVTEKVTDPELPHPTFLRTTCSTCLRWLKDELVPA